MAIEIVDLPINSMVIFHRFLYVYQRGHPQGAFGSEVFVWKSIETQIFHAVQILPNRSLYFIAIYTYLYNLCYVCVFRLLTLSDF